MKPHVLVVDDEAGIRYALRCLLEDLGCDVAEAEHGTAALAHVDNRTPDLILTDLRMPNMDGQTLLETLVTRLDAPPVVVLTAYGSERAAVAAMKAGAFDYFAKPFDADEVVVVVKRALRTATAEQRSRSLEAARLLSRWMVFESEAMYGVAERVARLEGRDATVLITGETGVGKELVARALVGTSARPNGPFVPINAAVLNEELGGAELFGHQKGAFTGAHADRQGLIRAAHAGTLFLDELGSLTPGVQAQLLRVLQERKVRPLGGVRAIPVDVRVIAATNQDLLRDAAFRDDLFYRLGVVRIQIPPLRERRSDIPCLVDFLARRAAERYGLPNPQVHPNVLRALEARPWPGNVRELENVVEAMVVMARDSHIDTKVLGLATGTVPMSGVGMRDQVASLERTLIARALAHSDGNRSEAARNLDVSRVSMLDKMRKYGIDG